MSSQAPDDSPDCPGPTVAGGMLFVESGYGSYAGVPGNVLLAFPSTVIREQRISRAHVKYNGFQLIQTNFKN